ncbi:MAG: hypothetical protein N2255_00455 [Kiritimatiellae bacterium]|nr:hypothetical protein [Kiritimatiellia bacterium]
MPTHTKQKIVDHAIGILKKKYPVGELPQRSVIQHFIYGIIREGTTKEIADRCFENLISSFIDWNELRVSTPSELVEVMHGLPEASAKARRIIGVLQEWFELTYSFDMEEVAKKGIKEGTKKLQRLKEANDFAIAWVTQRAWEGHAVPLDSGTIRVLKRLTVLDAEVEDVEALRSSAEHFIPKIKDVEFTEGVSMIAHEFCHEVKPKCGKCPLLPECAHGQQETKPAPKSKKAK